MKTKKILILFSGILFFTLIFALKSNAASTIITFDDGFTLSDLSGRYNGVSMDTSNGINNSSCVRLANTNNGVSQFSYEFKNLDNYTRYYIELYMKTSNIIADSSKEEAKCGATAWLNSIGVVGKTSASYTRGSTEYTKIELTAYPKDGNLRLIGELRDANGQAYFDNLSIRALPSIDLISTKGNFLLKADQDIINAAGSREALMTWVNHMQQAYDDFHELTTVTPPTRTENGPIILDALLLDDEMSSGAFAYSQVGGIICVTKSSFIDCIKGRNRRGDSDWIFSMLHELGHQFDTNEAWNFEGETFTDLHLSYVIEKEKLKSYPSAVPDDKANQIYDSGTGIKGIYEYICQHSDSFLGEPSKYGGGKYGTYSIFGAVYKFLEIKESIGWSAFKNTNAELHQIYGKDTSLTKKDKFYLYINTLNKYASQDVKSFFTTKEFDACVNYVKGYDGTTVQSVSLNTTNLRLKGYQNNIATLTASLTPNTGSIDWTSSNPNVARVSNGKIQTLQEGTATITAKSTDSGKSATCEIIVDNTSPVITVTYSTLAPTRDNIVVTLNSNEALKEQSGWKLSSDKKALTKTYTSNTQENITVADLVGNTTPVKIAFNNIDRVAPSLSIAYSTTSPTRFNVSAMITSNEKLQPLNGWTLSADGKILTKTYTSNIKESITVLDLAGNSSTIDATISNIDTTPAVGTIQYSTTKLTNKDITVTISTNEPVNPITGWTLSSNQQILTKVYSKNSVETVILSDLAGNTSSIKVTINTINKIAPNYEINYSTISPTNQDVQVTIKSDKKLQSISGWTLSSDKQSVTKKYSKNTSEKGENYTLQDLYGNTTQAIILIQNIDKTSPKLTTSYRSDSSESVTAFISSDKQLLPLDGWILLKDGKTLFKEYNCNIQEEVEVSDLAGNKAKTTISISSIKIASSSDKTLSNQLLPKAGNKIFILLITGIFLVFVIFSYCKYHIYKKSLKY